MPSIDLSQCENEPIHIPGMIQSHGYALSYDKKTLIITGVSANFKEPHRLIGEPLETLMVKDFSKRITTMSKASLQNFFYKVHPLCDGSQIDNAQAFDIVWSDCGEEAMLELMPSPLEASERSSHLTITENFQHILPHNSMKAIAEQAVHEIQASTGFDRVMAYQFDDDFNGCVIAETKRESMIPYLDLNFPASDIPAQARELYRKQTVRVINDVNYTPIDFIRQSGRDPLDMTYSHLRSVSPVHIEYLTNMHVAATLTISLIVDGALWGLIACHHQSKHSITLSQLEYTRSFGVILSGIIKTRIDSALQRSSVHLHATLETTLRGIQAEQHDHKNLLKILSKKAELFSSLFESNSFAFVRKKKIVLYDSNCSEQEILKLIELAEARMEDNLFYSSHLMQEFPECPEHILVECAGALIIKIPASHPSYWIWFRKEKTQTLSWGGDPKNKVTVDADGKISPRSSFASFKEIVRFKSDPWDRATITFVPNFIAAIEGFYRWFETQIKIGENKQKILDMKHERRAHFSELLESLVDIIGKRDAYTEGHNRRVAQFCLDIATQMQWSEKKKAQLYEAGVLHDIGKVVVPDAILLKPGHLREKEYKLIQIHLTAGYEILKGISYYAPLAEIMKYHHEKYDGSGYPQGVSRDAIPLASHIMIVADAIDAMTSNRIYQPRKSMKEALDEILRYRGIWYHPDVVDAALKALETMKDDPATTQMPLTELEGARFSYYFKDSLTDLYNISYLKMIITQHVDGIFYPHFILAEVINMTDYNHTYGWHSGDVYIQQFSYKLQEIFPGERIFRVFGDDFIIGCQSLDEAQEYLHKISDAGLDELRCNSFDVDHINAMLHD